MQRTKSIEKNNHFVFFMSQWMATQGEDVVLLLQTGHTQKTKQQGTVAQLLQVNPNQYCHGHIWPMHTFAKVAVWCDNVGSQTHYNSANMLYIYTKEDMLCLVFV